MKKNNNTKRFKIREKLPLIVAVLSILNLIMLFMFDYHIPGL